MHRYPSKLVDLALFETVLFLLLFFPPPGWLMPQRTSYFALKLPRGWWILGMDLALDDDIDIEQFQFFANLAESSMAETDCCVIVTHGKSAIELRCDNLSAWHASSTCCCSAELGSD